MAKAIKKKKLKRKIRHKRGRAKIFGTAQVPRLCVFRSCRHIYGQLIDDEKGRVLLAVNDLGLSGQQKSKKVKVKESQKNEKVAEAARKGKIFLAFETGKKLAQEARQRKIERVVFDRSGYQYHGRVKALAEGAREGGLKF